MAGEREDAKLCLPVADTFMPITLIIIAITCIVSYMAFNNRRLMEDLILWPPAITRQREYHRLVTYGVVHADFNHLLFNMFTLYFFGRAMEPFFTDRLGYFRLRAVLPGRPGFLDPAHVSQESRQSCLSQPGVHPAPYLRCCLPSSCWRRGNGSSCW